MSLKRGAIESLVLETEKLRIGRAPANNGSDTRVDLKSSSGLVVFKSPTPSVGALVGTTGVLGTDATVVLTAAQVLLGVIGGDPNANTTALTLPTVASVIAALESPEVGDSWYLTIQNTGGGDEPMLVGVGSSGWTLSGSGQIEAPDQSAAGFSSGSALFMFRLTDVDATPAGVCYRIA